MHSIILLIFFIRIIAMIWRFIWPLTPIFYVKYVKGDKDVYHYDDGSNAQMNLIGRFFFYDCVYSLEKLRSWLENDASNEYEGQAVKIKEQNGKIRLLEVNPLRKSHPKMSFERAAFIELLNRWEKIYKQKPQKIIITSQGSVVMIDGEYASLPNCDS